MKGLNTITELKNKVKNSSNTDDDSTELKRFMEDNNSDNELINWRKSDSPFTFYYDPDTDELSYMNGVGFINDKKTTKQKNVMCSVNSLFGYSIALSIVIEILTKFLLINILKNGEVPVVWDLFSGYIKCSEFNFTVINIVTGILKYAFPIIFLLLALKMPYEVISPKKSSIVSDCKKFFSYIPFLVFMFIIALTCAVLLFSELRIFSLNASNYTYFIPQNTLMRRSMMLYYFLILPILKAFLLNGIILQTLRQFSDTYAIIMTGIFALLLGHNLGLMGYEFLLCVVVSFITIKTNTISTSILSYSLIGIFQYIIQISLTINTDYYIKAIIYLILVIAIAISSKIVKNKITSNNDLFTIQKSKSIIPKFRKLQISFVNSGMFLSIFMVVLIQILVIGFEKLI